MSEPWHDDGYRGGGGVGPPGPFGEPVSAPRDHDWKLQVIMELQKSVGQLDERTKGLAEQIGHLRTDIGGIRGEMQRFVGHGEFRWGVGIIVTILLAIGGLVWRGPNAAPSPPAITQPSPAPPPEVTPQQAQPAQPPPPIR